jgi:hypothetical protein
MRSLAQWKMTPFALANCVALVSVDGLQTPSITEVRRIRAMRVEEVTL